MQNQQFITRRVRPSENQEIKISTMKIALVTNLSNQMFYLHLTESSKTDIEFVTLITFPAPILNRKSLSAFTLLSNSYNTERPI
jgi:hypothetical protein